MSKIKVSLASGNIFEKPLVTCFQGVSANYIVFDNEMNGSMGLPIICISKLVGNKLEKIYDQSEWSNVKENLKSIISGNNFIYLTIILIYFFIKLTSFSILPPYIYFIIKKLETKGF